MKLLRELAWRLFESRAAYDDALARLAHAGTEIYATETAIFRASGALGLEVVCDKRREILASWNAEKVKGY